MTSADFLRFVIIVSLGVLAFITFLVAGTIIGLMWLESWSCGECKIYPVGIYILGILGILFMISIGVEVSEAPRYWWKWIKANWATITIIAVTTTTFLFVLNWDSWF